MVAFDNTILSILLFPDSVVNEGPDGKPVERAQDRVNALVTPEQQQTCAQLTGEPVNCPVSSFFPRTTTSTATGQQVNPTPRTGGRVVPETTADPNTVR